MNKQHQPEPVPMILRRMRPAILTHRLETHAHCLHVEPRLNLTVLRNVVGRIHTERVLPGDVGERVLWREEIVRDVLRRGQRWEAGTPACAAAANPQMDLTTSAPVPAVLVRRAPAAAPVETNGTATLAARPWPAPAPPHAPAVDVNRLTEQVIQQIDRRLQAHRERIGRR